MRVRVRGWLALTLACAALALAPGRARAAAPGPAASHHYDHIKAQILAKLGLTSRPQPRGAPPRDVVRQILARASDPQPEPEPEEHSMREVIAIAQRVFRALAIKKQIGTKQDNARMWTSASQLQL